MSFRARRTAPCYQRAPRGTIRTVLDVDAARTYNAKVAGKLWQQEDLPSPYCLVAQFSVYGAAFAHLVSAFQALAGLTVDGKLGTDTLGAMRSVMSALPAPEPGDDDHDDNEGTLEIPAPPEIDLRPRTGVSNCLRVGGKSVSLPTEMVEAGISASNFVDDGEHRFAAWKRRFPCQWFVIHESVSMSQKATITTLERKRARSIRQGKNGGKGYPYGVHLICAPDGHLSCHADLLDETLTHASQLNRHCIGCEWVNPYNPKWARPPFDRVIPAPWWCWVPRDAEALYTLPTEAQIVAAEHLCRFLPTVIEDLDYAFPTKDLNARRRRITRWANRGKPDAPGIVAHRDFDDHADGRYILEQVIAKSAQDALNARTRS